MATVLRTNDKGETMETVVVALEAMTILRAGNSLQTAKPGAVTLQPLLEEVGVPTHLQLQQAAAGMLQEEVKTLHLKAVAVGAKRQHQVQQEHLLLKVAKEDGAIRMLQLLKMMEEDGTEAKI
jgi:hypothetical protein